MTFKVTSRFAFALALLSLVSSVNIQSASAQMGMTMGRKEMIHMSLLKCYTDLGRNAEAEGEYNVLLAMKPNDGVLHFNYARLLVAAGKKGPALAHYRKAAQSNPGNADFQGQLGQMLYNANDFSGASRALGIAMQLPGGDRYKGAYESAVRQMQQIQQNRLLQQQSAPAKSAGGGVKKHADDDDDE
jgi:predicted Zn-dependent protease